jgi:NAD(P)H-nitrite reductase large subunit
MALRHVIIGSGIAGLCAAEAIRAADSTASVTMVSEEPHDFYSRPGLAYLLRGDVPERQLWIRRKEDLRGLRLERVNAKVEAIAPEAHELVLPDNRRLAYDRLLLATGALAVPPPFPGKELQGIVKLDGLDDTRHILKLARRGKPAVVVGGGITALELAEGLNARGMKVHYFLRGKRYWGDVLDETESTIVMDRLRHEGVTLQLETQVKQAVGQGGWITAVETQAGATFPCRVLAVAIGVRPRVDLAKQAGLKVNKGVVVDPYLRTSAVDIYAAGDCAEVVDPRTGAATLDVLWPTALVQGQVAGRNMLGANEPYTKGVSVNVTMLTGLKVALIGAVGGGKNEDLVAIMRGESESWRVVPRSLAVSDHNEVNRIRLVVGERTLVGALVMGDQTWARHLQRLIVAGADITAIRPALLAGGPAALEQLANFLRQWERSGRGVV